MGWSDHAAHCATKGGLDAVGRVMANELGRKGIRVNCVSPTVTLTPMGERAWSYPGKSDPMLKRIPLDAFFGRRMWLKLTLFTIRRGRDAQWPEFARRRRPRGELTMGMVATESRTTNGHSSLVMG